MINIAIKYNISMPSQDTELLTPDSDDEPIVKTTESHDDFPSMSVDLFRRINFKTAIFLFITGIFIFSDIFIENVLPKKYINADCADTIGTTIQLTMLVLAYLVIDLIVQGGLL